MEDETSVRVALRIRPQSAAERIDMCRVCTYVTAGHPQVILGKDKAFTFDHVFDFESKQFMIYEQCLKGLVEGCFDGYNATVLAYGQTGSGKTYTMGTGFDVATPEEEEGIIPRAVAHLFEGIDKRKTDAKQRNEPLPDFKVTVQFMELYNEELMDLFDFDNNKSRKSNAKIHEDANGHIYTLGVTMKPVNSTQDTLNCLQQGALSRTTASTNMNAQSSRSHAIFTIHVKQQRVVKLGDDEEKTSSDNINNYEYEMLTAKFNFVDLAGSERLKRTGATGDRAKEGISINCGLLALGNVISALGDVMKKGSHVPYRDSKLTRLLQDSLGGNSRTLMIACVSPSDRDFMETLNTLKYANRARNIKNKVVVNQDKTSKQISSLRLEIQKLTMELMEFKQGKRISGVEDGQVSDVSHENVMLKTENDKLRVRIKALQQTIDTQSSRITDLISSQVLASVDGNVNGGVEDLIQKYLKEIEELRNKLTESEAMAMAITRHAALKSRIQTPSAPESATSVLEMAKLDVARQRQKAQKLTHNEEEAKDQPWDEQSSDDSSTEEDENEEQGDDDDEVDDDDDDDSEEDETAQDDNLELSEDLAELSTEISIKQKLIDELETSQKKLQSIKTQYEEKLSLLHNKIKETETERDQVLQSIKNQGSKSDERVRKVRDDYEKKINHLQGELKKMQAAKKEHARLLRQKAQNEQQLRTFQSELSELKKTKVRLMKQMKEEAAKNKQQETQRNKEIAQLKKESRLRQMTIKTLETEKRQRDIVLKRKQEEVKALRRQQKPVSGKLGEQRNQTIVSGREVNGLETSTQTSYQSTTSQGSYSSSTLTKSSSSSRLPVAAGKPTGLPVKSPRRKTTLEQASRSAKKKWDIIDKKVTSLIIKKQTISNMESDMDRWIQDRDRLSKQLEKCQMKYDSLVAFQKEESNAQEVKEQLEALTAHLDYVQENITDCQTSIMEMEEQGGDTTEIGESFATCTLSEARILLEHFLAKVISLGHEASSKEASAKEVEARLNAMKQHNELQQELLQHVLQYHDNFSSIENLAAVAAGTDSELSGSELRDRLMGSLTSLNSLKDESGTISRSSSGNTIKDSSEEGQSQPAPKPKDKARRRTGTQEEFLYPDRIKTRRSPLFDPPGDDDECSSSSNLPVIAALPCPGDPKTTRQISSELMQKLLELEKSRKGQSSDSIMPPPPATQSEQTQSQGVPVKTSRSNSLNGNTTVAVPASMVRGNIKSKSARSFPLSRYGSAGSGISIQARSQPASPALQRKSLPDKPGAGVDDSVISQKTSENVFARLTSSLAQESDPDVGRMLPLRPPVGKPAPLVCTYAATGHNSAVLSLDVTEDLMITGSKDRTVKVWDLNTGEETLSCAGHKRDVVAVRYCRKSQRIFGASQNIIKVWDMRDGKCIKSLTPPGSSLGSFLSSMTSETQINDLKLSSDGSMLYAAMGTTVRIWELDNYSMTGKLGGHAGPVMTILLQESSKESGRESLVFTGSRDHYVKIFEINGSNVGVQSARNKLEPPHYDGVQSLALKGKYLFSGSRDNSIKKWDIETQQLVQHFTGAHKDWVSALDFLRPQNVLLSGCRSGVLKLWRVENGAPVCEIKAHRHPINAVCTNSSCVFTASSDRLVRLWRVTGTLEEQLSELERAVGV
ncbi:kinesin-like protein KIF21A [Montipora foliosa]|uniref:kinesin-like protein KIF21A n=1 Tax=Montipora foliosa TaxID=591990 RepID=UPI0035F16B19